MTDRPTDPRRDEPARDRPPLTDRTRTATSLDPDHSLTREQATAEPAMRRAVMEDTRGEPAAGYKVHPAARILVRGPWEMAATITIALGVVMLMQPFALWLYTYSFITLLVGTIMFMIVSHFPEAPRSDAPHGRGRR